MDTKFNRSIAQIKEWTYGVTHVDFEIDKIQFRKCGGDAPENHVSFRVVTEVRRVSNMKHPGALAFEAIGLSITGIGVDKDGRLDELLNGNGEDADTWVPSPTDKGTAELPKLDPNYNMILLADNGGFSTVNVQILLYLFDGGQKSVSRTFIFRNNQMNYIR